MSEQLRATPQITVPFGSTNAPKQSDLAKVPTPPENQELAKPIEGASLEKLDKMTFLLNGRLQLNRLLIDNAKQTIRSKDIGNWARNRLEQIRNELVDIQDASDEIGTKLYSKKTAEGTTEDLSTMEKMSENERDVAERLQRLHKEVVTVGETVSQIQYLSYQIDRQPNGDREKIAANIEELTQVAHFIRERGIPGKAELESVREHIATVEKRHK